jgi:hypothetical protein
MPSRTPSASEALALFLALLLPAVQGLALSGASGGCAAEILTSVPRCCCTGEPIPAAVPSADDCGCALEASESSPAIPAKGDPAPPAPSSTLSDLAAPSSSLPVVSWCSPLTGTPPPAPPGGGDILLLSGVLRI